MYIICVCRPNDKQKLSYQYRKLFYFCFCVLLLTLIILTPPPHVIVVPFLDLELILSMIVCLEIDDGCVWKNKLRGIKIYILFYCFFL
jgi:hypothetical protein